MLASHNGLFSIPEIDPNDPPADLIYQSSFLLTLEMEEPDSDIESTDNLAPFFIPEPTDLYAYYNEDFEHSFGDPLDYEGDQVTVTIDLGEADSLEADYDFTTNTLSISSENLNEDSQAVSEIIITLTDDHSDDDSILDNGPGITVYTFKLYVTERTILLSAE